MWRFCAGALAVLMLLPVLHAQEDTKKKAEPPSPAQQLSALTLEHREAMNEFMAAYRKAKTNEARQKLLRESYPKPDQYAPRFMELAEKYADDPVALGAVSWILQYASTAPEGATAAKIAVEKALEDPKNPQSMNNLRTVATRMRGPVAEEAGKKLLEILGENIKDPRSLSTLAMLISRTRGSLKEAATKKLDEVLDSVKDDPDKIDLLASIVSARGMPSATVEKVTRILVENFIDNEKLAKVCLMLGRSSSSQPTLRQIIERTKNDSVKGHAMFALATSMLGRTAKPNKEAEELLAKVVSDYADVESFRGKKLGEMAAGPLFKMQHLQIGMVAPNIEGEDVDGAPFQLADYKGKVTVLDFWGDW